MDDRSAEGIREGDQVIYAGEARAVRVTQLERGQWQLLLVGLTEWVRAADCTRVGGSGTTQAPAAPRPEVKEEETREERREPQAP